MSDLVLSVRPAGDSWLVDCPDGFDPLHFASPAEAAEKARLLARCLAEAGFEVRILVHDDARQLVDTTCYSADRT